MLIRKTESPNLNMLNIKSKDIDGSRFIIRKRRYKKQGTDREEFCTNISSSKRTT